jgi:AraC-like DNA-binding protein
LDRSLRRLPGGPRGAIELVGDDPATRSSGRPINEHDNRSIAGGLLVAARADVLNAVVPYVPDHGCQPGYGEQVRNGELILAADGFLVAEVACGGGSRGWSPEEPVTGPAIVLVRSGIFRRRVNGVDLVVDPMVAYLEHPGTVQQIAHPVGGDLCTVIVPPPEAFDLLTAAPERLLHHRVVPADVDVRHRALLARYRQGADTFELVERTTRLAGRLLTGFFAGASKGSTDPPSRRAGILADQVRELLEIHPERGLRELALATGVSPSHLSRSFRRATGMTLTRYRRQLRIKRALQRLAEGEVDLARLAADLGFSDQAHFTRATRLEAGATPGQLRTLLSPSS